MLRITLYTLLCLSSLYASAQPLAAYVDIQNQLMVWDKGMIRKIDYLPPTQMKIGRNTIPYLDNSRAFKIYYGGSTHDINIGFTNAFFVSDNLVAYLNAKSLNVFDRGTSKRLTGICDQYFLADSVLMYLDGQRQQYSAYYNGQVYQIESYFPDSTLSSIKVSDNIIAYDNFANQFRIFYHGVLIAQEDYPVSSFDAGRNTVAYVDANRQFKIFHNGQNFVAEDYPPQSYTVGDNLVAYVSNDGYFKIFYQDSIRSIGFFQPIYQVGDNVVGYKDPSGYFKAFYKGEITELESYYPDNYTIQYNSIAYVNKAGTLRLFTEGETYDVTNATLDNWELHYDVLKYQIGQSIVRVFYKGVDY
ncbi:MAG: hypothetical protein JSS82_01490 [Bacteroidetes bacterium]|nr:hypothetical protein [Bacteroidota bacterium]